MSEELEKKKSYVYKAIEERKMSLNKYQKILDEAIKDDEKRKIEVYSARIDKIKGRINSLQSQLMYMRENTESDLEERRDAQLNFSKEVTNVVPDGVPLVFHGNRDIAMIYEILKSGGLKTPEERGVDFKSFATKIDVANKYDIHVPVEFAEPGSATCRPYGAIFAFYPKENEIEKGLGKFGSEVPGGVESINFKEENDRFVAIITTEENIERIQNWLKEFGMDDKKVFTHSGFIEMCKARYKEQENNSSLQDVKNELEVSSDELEKMQVLGRGACSKVYKYGEDRVIKILNQNGIQMHNEEQFIQLMKIKSQLCTFPEQKVQMNGSFQGYTMEFVDGKTLMESIDKIDLPDLISALERAEMEIKELSPNKVLFKDLNQGGIMWDDKKKRIRIIDTDFFEINNEITAEQCYNANLFSFNTLIEMELGIINGERNKLATILYENPQFGQKYNEYIMASIKGNEMSITELIKTAADIIRTEYRDNNIHSFGDMKNAVGMKETEKIDFSEIPIFTPPQEQDIVSTQSLGKQVVAEMSDVTLTDETQQTIENIEKNINERKNEEQNI